MLLLTLAWRNVWRNKKRSFIITFAIALGLWAGLFLVSFYNGMIGQRMDSALRIEFSHIQIHAKEYQHDHELKFCIPESDQMMDQLKSRDSIEAVSGRVIAYGMLANARGHAGLKTYGVQVGTEKSLTRLNEKIVEGDYLSPSADNEMVIGRALAKKMSIRLRSKVVFTFEGLEGNLVSTAFRIVGFYETHNALFDDHNAFTNISNLDTLAGIPGSLHEIAIFVKPGVEIEQIQKHIQKEYPLTIVQTWKDISPELSYTSSMTDQIMYIYMGIILLALSFGIINTMLMSVLERTAELGMLMAIGMSSYRVFGMILLETFLLVASASPAGFALAMVCIQYFGKHGIHLEKYKDVYQNFGYSSTIYPTIQMHQFQQVISLLILTAFLSSLAPAMKAIRIKPLKAIRK